jgi:hypothetical protein
MDRVFVHCHFYGLFLVVCSCIFIFMFIYFYSIFIFLVMFYVFVFLCFGCICQRLYTVGPSSPEGAQLNVRGGGFLFVKLLLV